MATIDIPTKIDIPDYIEVRLVKEDTLEVSNIFRILFDIFLTFYGGIIGIMFSNNEKTFIIWFLFFFLLIFSLIFLCLSLRYNKKSKVQELSSDSKLDSLPLKIKGFVANIKNEDIEQVKSILTNIRVKPQNFSFNKNSIKISHSTLRISEIDNNLIILILTKFKENDIEVIDEKLMI